MPARRQFRPLYWKYPETFLPHYSADLPHKVLEEADQVLAAFDLLADDASRREYLPQMRFRLHMEFEDLPPPVKHTIYFPKDVCSLLPDEVFIDCGAFDGDTIRLFLNKADGKFQKIVAFEPDPEKFNQLQQSITQYPQAVQNAITVYPTATGADKGVVRFSVQANGASFVGAGDVEVKVVTLDDVLQEASYIKMDIEGAELDTIHGARKLISEQNPMLAVSVYHLQNHIWKIPLAIHAINPNYKFFVRPHLREVWDLVCYAVPSHRMNAVTV